MANRISVFPPHKHLTSSKPIPASDALSRIQTYLDSAAHTAYLHPDCTFTESGPTVSNITTGGLVLHQLRRVEQGLRGVVLKPEIEGLDGVDVAGLEEAFAAENAAIAMELGVGERESNDKRLDARIAAQTLQEEQDAVEGDRDMDAGPAENYQEQLQGAGNGLLDGEIGRRDNIVAQGRAAQPPIVQTTGKKRTREESDGTPKDKEARKRMKKERTKQQRRDVEMAKQHEREQEADEEDTQFAAPAPTENGHVLDETPEEHDDAGPPSSYLPGKVSTTVVEPATTTPKDKERKRKHERDSTNPRTPSQLHSSQYSSTIDPDVTPKPRLKQQKDFHNQTRTYDTDRPSQATTVSQVSQPFALPETSKGLQAPQATPTSKAKGEKKKHKHQIVDLETTPEITPVKEKALVNGELDARVNGTNVETEEKEEGQKKGKKWKKEAKAGDEAEVVTNGVHKKEKKPEDSKDMEAKSDERAARKKERKNDRDRKKKAKDEKAA